MLLNVARRQLFFRMVAQRNTSYTGVISHLATGMFGIIAVRTLNGHPYWILAMFCLNHLWVDWIHVRSFSININ